MKTTTTILGVLFSAFLFLASSDFSGVDQASMAMSALLTIEAAITLIAIAFLFSFPVITMILLGGGALISILFYQSTAKLAFGQDIDVVKAEIIIVICGFLVMLFMAALVRRSARRPSPLLGRKG